jgi:chromosomal replication initiation ATPase DnaA
MGKTSLLFEGDYLHRTRTALPNKSSRVACVNKIIQVVANEHQLSEHAMRGTKSTVEISYPRNMAMYLAYVDSGLCIKEIAVEFNRSPSTVNSSIKFIHSGLCDPGIRLEVQELRVRY